MDMEQTRCTCGSELGKAGRRCDACGREILPAARNRRLGWAQLLVGILLTTATIRISIELVPWISGATQATGQPGAFTGSPHAARSIHALLGLTVAFALVCTGNGAWQIVTGQRSKVLLACAGGLLTLVVIAGWTALPALAD